MSGMQMALVGGSGGQLASGASWSANSTAASTGVRSATTSFNTDGTTASGSMSTPPNWYVPTTAGIGNNYSVRIVVNSSVNTNVSGMVSGTWYAMSSVRGVTFSNSNASVEGTGNATVYFSPDGGITAISVGSINWDVGYIA